MKVVRLKPYNEKQGHLLGSYTLPDGTKFTAGDMDIPSPIRVVSDKNVLAAVADIPQFEILDVKDEATLREMVQSEMEERARMGASPVRAVVEGAKADKGTEKPAEKPTEEAKAKAASLLRPESKKGGSKKTGRQSK